ATGDEFKRGYAGINEGECWVTAKRNKKKKHILEKKNKKDKHKKNKKKKEKKEKKIIEKDEQKEKTKNRKRKKKTNAKDTINGKEFKYPIDPDQKVFQKIKLIVK